MAFNGPPKKAIMLLMLRIRVLVTMLVIGVKAVSLAQFNLAEIRLDLHQSREDRTRR